MLQPPPSSGHRRHPQAKTYPAAVAWVSAASSSSPPPQFRRRCLTGPVSGRLCPPVPLLSLLLLRLLLRGRAVRKRLIVIYLRFVNCSSAVYWRSCPYVRPPSLFALLTIGKARCCPAIALLVPPDFLPLTLDLPMPLPNPRPPPFLLPPWPSPPSRTLPHAATPAIAAPAAPAPADACSLCRYRRRCCCRPF